ncbi:hypothetical protein CIHG_05079 [Coccidioides immitis H538.4]|uniref:Uncharacterized protein n=4 Tax=Coccidioides TaxID=5500 RepID=A0A0J8QQ19_COCIT|nr:hypothetical protein CPAG_04515 [Coccidioides posadasii RMSCC 3488]KMP04321.1 hypothetical protein CIRG_04013 [Coccidioides immitis RMSCC 2394]KMU73453.1 hypothetical protein CISG_03589 [Coccidioides immitis RMSCC 3703]KMU87138.1 hypothetical protein CIHG_05079 [Coccidioides immitis H538.4]
MSIGRERSVVARFPGVLGGRITEVEDEGQCGLSAGAAWGSRRLRGCAEIAVGLVCLVSGQKELLSLLELPFGNQISGVGKRRRSRAGRVDVRNDEKASRKRSYGLPYA